jgi:site-specific DNA-methyltransferase (adenine-specific)
LKQESLYTGIDLPSITIEEAAIRAGVSTATIRNWIKTKYLSKVGKGSVSLESFEKFQGEVSGIEKLTHRANKSSKDDHDHEALATEIISKITSYSSSLDEIGSNYEEKLSDSYRNKEGIYYTPQNVISDLFRKPNEDTFGLTFCDPCCGSGNFIIQAIQNGFKPENIYGYDIDPVAVEITKARIYEKCGYKSSNICVADFLDIATDNSRKKYDYIYTNPPWGKKLAKEIRSSKGVQLGAGNSIDTCSIFFFACLASLKTDGTLGLLLPDSFFNIAVFEDARMQAVRLEIERLIDYGKAFKGLVTKAQAIVIKNTAAKLNSETECQFGGSYFNRKSSSFIKNPKTILNLHCSEKDAAVLEYLYLHEHITLKGRAKWGLGIVTGNNKKHIHSSPSDGLLAVYKGSDITARSLLPASHYIASDFSSLQQVAPMSIYEAKSKLVYKFISSKLCFFYDDKQRFFLNSANILVPEDDFQVSQEVLADYLSSSLMNWIFSKTFNTHKILRGDLESLPIYVDVIGDMKHFDEEQLLNNIGLEENNGTYRLKK